MAITFGGKVQDPKAGSTAKSTDLLRLAITRLNAGQPKSALDCIHDAVFEIAEFHGIGLPF